MLPPHLLDNLATYGEGEQANAALQTIAAVDVQRRIRERNRIRFGATDGGLVPARASEKGLRDWLCKMLNCCDDSSGGGGDDGSEDDAPPPTHKAEARRVIYDGGNDKRAGNDEVARREDESRVSDADVNRAYSGFGEVFRYYHNIHGRNSIDDQGMTLRGIVHFGREYMNAFWDGETMSFGDGDGRLFLDFTRALDVLAHEVTHGVIQNTINLAYSYQAGALNEHLADVFGVMTRQRAESLDVAQDASWLIGSDILGPEVQGKGLRDMLNPGTAYDDPKLGKDPQPAHMSNYVRTEKDNGGVHINSGIPNRAFALAARELGGKPWTTVGPVWYRVLTNDDVPPDLDFGTFAGLTIEACKSTTVSEAVKSAWGTVGVTAK